MSAREDDGQIFINQYTSLIKANSSDVNFDPCKEQSPAGTSSSPNLPDSSATDITLQQKDKLTRNQRVNVKAALTMGCLEPKEVEKRNGSKGRVKEDCVLEGKTGNAIIHLWDDSATTLTTGQSYEIKNLSVKNFNGKAEDAPRNNNRNHVHSNNIIDPLMKELKGKELLINIKKTITVEEFKFTDKVNTFMVCQIPNCKKKKKKKKKRHMLLIAKSSLVLVVAQRVKRACLHVYVHDVRGEYKRQGFRKLKVSVHICFIFLFKTS